MKTFTFFIILMLIVNLNVSAQGFKDILEKLKTLEVSLDSLEAKQASEAQVSQKTMNELQEVITRLNTRIGMLPEPKNVPPVVQQKTAEDKPKLICKPYGYVKLDIAYDQARSNNGNYVFWVKSPVSSDKKDSEFNMTPRQTRLGLDLNYEGLKGRNVSARFEMDFYGGGTENKTMLMMRHSFLKVDFGKYYLLAGQTSDVFSPLVPNTVNYTVLWNCGNIGYRSPQIQFGNKVTEGLEIVGAVSRNLPGDVDNDGNDDGEYSSIPQCRLAHPMSIRK